MTLTEPEKYLTIDGEEYLTISQACDYLLQITENSCIMIAKKGRKEISI